MNILLTTLSAISRNPMKIYSYQTPEEHFISGALSNEAPTRYLIRRLYQKRYQIFDKVIVLSTDKCKELIPLIDTKIELTSEYQVFPHITSEHYYREIVMDEITKVLPEKSRSELNAAYERNLFEFINTDKAHNSDLLQGIQRQAEGELEANIYADLTGGSRVQSLLATMVLGWLEAYHYNVECVVYGNINNVPNRVDDITDVYKMVNAVIANAKANDRDYHGNIYDQELISLNYEFIINEKEKEPIKLQGMQEIVPLYDKDKEPYLFFSYAHKDSLPAKAILKHLNDAGFRVWYDDDIPLGADWEKMINDKLDHCEYALVLLSRKYLHESSYCAKEINHLLERHGIHKVYLLCLEEISQDDIPHDFYGLKKNFNQFQHVIFQPIHQEEFYRKLMKTLTEKAATCQ